MPLTTKGRSTAQLRGYALLQEVLALIAATGDWVIDELKPAGYQVRKIGHDTVMNIRRSGSHGVVVSSQTGSVPPSEFVGSLYPTQRPVYLHTAELHPTTFGDLP